MPKMFSIFIILLFNSFGIFGKEPDPYVVALEGKKFLKLPDGRELILVRLYNDQGPNMHMRFFMRHNKKVIWDVTYHEDLKTLWADAHFLPLFDKTFIKDLNNDGYPEIAVQVWHGGNAMQFCKAVIFTIRKNKLVPIKTRHSNYEFAHMIYSNEEEAKKSISELVF